MVLNGGFVEEWRLGVKFGLIRALFGKFGDTPERHDFLRVMDWMMALPEELEQRFGTVPGNIRKKIKQASEADLRTWVSRALSAPDLETVFQPGAN